MPKYKIDDEAEIPAALKDEYEARDGAFYLKIEGGEDVAGLKANNAKLLGEKKTLQARVDATTAAEEAARLEALRAKGDVTALEASYNEKLTASEAKYRAEIDKRDNAVKQAAINEAATTLTAKISTAPGLMLPHVKQRLRAEIGDDGAVIVRVLDPQGKASAHSVNDLEKELLANKDFAPIIRASSATGGGAGSGSGNAGGGNNGGAGSASKRIFDMTSAEKKAHYDRDPAAFKAQVLEETQQDQTT